MEWGKHIIQTVYMIMYRCEGFKLNRRGGQSCLVKWTLKFFF